VGSKQTLVHRIAAQSRNHADNTDCNAVNHGIVMPRMEPISIMNCLRADGLWFQKISGKDDFCIFRKSVKSGGIAKHGCRGGSVAVQLKNFNTVFFF